VHDVVSAARRTLEPEPAFEPAQLRSTFVVHATDYVVTILGAAVDRILRARAPGVCLRFVPNTPDDSSLLRDHGSDLAIGIYGELPQEMRSRQLLTDRFVCVARHGHPALSGRLTLDQFVALPHVQIAPRGKPGGYLDDVLRERGLRRTVARAVPYFFAGLQLVSQTDYLLTISERMARHYEKDLRLRIFEVPLKLRAYALSLVWHPRIDGEAGHQFLREVFVQAAELVAGDRHESARTRLDPTDATSGQSRKRPRRQ
jgi:DNA-binding transcriptional LysR family regulator